MNIVPTNSSVRGIKHKWYDSSSIALKLLFLTEFQLEFSMFEFLGAFLCEDFININPKDRQLH